MTDHTELYKQLNDMLAPITVRYGYDVPTIESSAKMFDEVMGFMAQHWPSVPSDPTAYDRKVYDDIVHIKSLNVPQYCGLAPAWYEVVTVASIILRAAPSVGIDEKDMKHYSKCLQTFAKAGRVYL